MDLIPLISNQPWFAQAVIVVIVINTLLSAVSKSLETLKMQEKAPWLAKVAAVVQKLVDVVSANVKH